MLSRGASSDRRPTTERRRWITRAAVCLLVGAIINVLVAVACAVWCPVVGWIFIDTFSESEAEIKLGLPTGWTDRVRGNLSPMCTTRVAIGTGTRLDTVNIEFNDLTATEYNVPSFGMLVQRSGWPLLCMSGSYQRDARSPSLGGPTWSPNVPWPPTRWLSGFEAPSWLSPADTPLYRKMKRAVPSQPDALPFIANTLFFTAAVFVPWCLLILSRENHRLRRGMCPNCAYDLRGLPAESTKCPECGASKSTVAT